MKLPRTLFAVFLLSRLVSIHAATPNGIFGDNMVLQRDRPVGVWGTGTPNEKVTVTFGGQSKSAAADAAGKWSVKLDPMKANSDPQELTVQSEVSTWKGRNILVGEVWICGGQSNMEWALARSTGGPEAIAAANNPLLRMGRVPHNSQASPAASVAIKWDETLPGPAKFFSAIPFWFGDKLQRALGVPVGIINSSFGGTTVQAWMSAETLGKGPWPQDTWTSPALARADYDKRLEAARPIMEKYAADKAAAIAAKKPSPPAPSGYVGEYKGVASLWNGEIAPILPFSIRGVAWYQGENNAYVGHADTYKDLLPAMINDWRTGFQQPDLPFVIFQIARNRKWQTDPNEKSGIAELQEAQDKVARKTPHAALIVTTDQGGPDVHYVGKEPIATRAVQSVLDLAYGQKSDCASPVFERLEIAGDKAILHFRAGSGLVARDGEPAGFVIAGEDRKFAFATAVVDGDTVTVSSPAVPKPVAVRYGWADLPKVNLFGKNGYPVSTFRTDDWPLN